MDGGSYSYDYYTDYYDDGSYMLVDGFKPIPDGYNMGDDPVWMVVDRSDGAPEGYYLPDMDFVHEYLPQLMSHSDEVIGVWAIVAFNGGKYEGSGYGDNVICVGGCLDDPLYDVKENPDIGDILVVAADPHVEQPAIPPVV